MNWNYFEKQKPHFLNLGFKEQNFDLLKKYIELLICENEELNLISRKMTFEELIDNHVIDCMLPLKSIPQNLKYIADLGSGGGLPALIYAIHFKETQFILFEKSILKQNFLKKAKVFIPNISVQSEVTHDLDKTQLVTARGFKSIDTILEMTRIYFETQKPYFLLKGRREKIDEELALAKKKFKNIEIQIQSLKSPVLEVERHLVLVKRLG